MAFNLKSIASQLLKKLRPGQQTWGYSEDQLSPYGGSSGDPQASAPSGPSIKPITYAPSRPDPSVLADAQAMQSEALGILRQPAPVMQPGKVDPVEAGLSTLFGLLIKNPAASSRAFNAPSALAGARADIQNTNAANAFGQQQRTAQAMLGHSQKVIAEWYDRDQAADKIEADMRKAEISGKVREFAAKAKNDAMLVKSLAQLAATGGVTVPGVKEILSLMDPDAAEDELEAKAAEIVNQVNTNPSMQARMKQAQIEVSQQKSAETETKRLWDDLQNPNATFAQQYQIARQLQASGQIDPGVDLTTFLEKMGAQTQNLQAGAALKGAQTKQITELLPLRKQKFQADIGLSQQRAEKLAKETELMDEESAAKVAKAYADIDNVRSQIGDREEDRKLGYARLKTEQLIRSQDGLKTALTTLSTQANTLRNRATARYKDLQKATTDEEKKAIQEDIDQIGQAIKAYKQQYGEIESELKRIRGALGSLDDSEAQPPNAIPPMTPDLSGPIGGGSPQGGSKPKPKKPTAKKPGGFGKPR